jgi:fibronectin type 3 domain-containing protein
MSRCGYAIALCCFLLLCCCGCGRKTLPIPPQAAIAVPIADLQHSLDEQGATLSWTYPILAESGEKIDNVRTFTLYKSEVGAEDFCADCPVQYDLAITLSGAGVKPGARMTYTDTDLQSHYRYTYKVVSGSGWNIVSGDSNRVSFQWESPLPPPTGLTLQVADRGLTIGWQPVTTGDGGPVAEAVRYQVYRSNKGREFDKIGEPVAGLSYVDQGLDNGRKYFYQVRAVRTVDDTELFGAASEVIAGMARNVIPPVPPEKFTIVAAADGVKILWENIAQQGVAGFRVYRRQAGDQEMTLVGETDRASFSFTDRNLPEGDATLYYAVTAIDDAVPPNESAFSREVELPR